MPNSKPTPVTMDAVYTAPGYLFRRMQQIAVALFIEECKAFDLTPVQYAALVTISTHPGIDATRLSAVIAFDRSTLGNVIERLQAYSEAGADVLYSPGISTREEIAAVVKAVAPKPVNLLIGGASDLSLQAVADLGVRRISVGGALARMAWTGVMKAAKEMAEKGTFTEFANGYPGGELNKMFK